MRVIERLRRSNEHHLIRVPRSGIRVICGEKNARQAYGLAGSRIVGKHNSRRLSLP
jgi:hypothetical protein